MSSKEEERKKGEKRVKWKKREAKGWEKGKRRKRVEKENKKMDKAKADTKRDRKRGEKGEEKKRVGDKWGERGKQTLKEMERRMAKNIKNDTAYINENKARQRKQK